MDKNLSDVQVKSSLSGGAKSCVNIENITENADPKAKVDLGSTIGLRIFFEYEIDELFNRPLSIQ